MATLSMQEVIWLMISCVILILGIVLIVKIVGIFFKPSEQIALANVDSLQSAMNEACFRTNTITNPVELDFRLPQNVPTSSFGSIAALTRIPLMPQWTMKNMGDPEFVLYYEAFPAGEAVGWEALEELEDRSIAYVNFGENKKVMGGKSGDSVADILNAIKTDTKTNPTILGNVMVTGGFDVQTGEYRNKQKGFFGYGEWKDKNAFTFQNYMGWSGINKTLIKYQPCGAYTLCLKTPSGIYRYPLKECEKAGIKYVQLVYDNRKNVAGLLGTIVGGVAGTVITFEMGTGLLASSLSAFGNGMEIMGGSIISIISKGTLAGLFVAGGFAGGTAIAGLSAYGLEKAFTWYLGMFLSYKTSDFYIASPCDGMHLEIKQTTCNLIDDDTRCEKMINYPIYEFDEKGYLKNIGTHYSCVQSLGGVEINEDSNTEEVKCLQVIVKDVGDGFCWTPNPYIHGYSWGTDTFAKALDFLPVMYNTEYMENTYTINGVSVKTPIVELKSVELPSMLKGAFKSLLNVDWWWPSNKF